MTTNYCSICGVECSGKMKIEARGTKDYMVCTICFNKYANTDLKEIRRLIKK